MDSPLGQRIQWILKKTGWSQRELSRRAGLGETHVGLILRAASRNPEHSVELRTLQGIAAAAEVSLAWLSSGEGSPDHDDDARGPSTTDDSTPIMKNVPGFAEVEAIDRAANPAIEAIYWERGRMSAPFLIFGPAQPGDALKLARMAKALGSPERLNQMIADREARIKVLEARLEEQHRREQGGAKASTGKAPSGRSS